MTLTAEQSFSLTRDAIMMAIAALVFYWGRDRQLTQTAIENHFTAIEGHLTATDLRIESYLKASEDRFDKASGRASKLASLVQGIVGRLDRLPEELREKKTFCSHDTVALMISDAIQRSRSGGPGAMTQ